MVGGACWLMLRRRVVWLWRCRSLSASTLVTRAEALSRSVKSS